MKGLGTAELLGGIDVCKRLLKDSEKLLPSAVRCIGFLIDALVLDPIVHREVLYLILSDVLRCNAQAGTSSIGSDLDFTLVEERISCLTHKLAFAVSQALGYIGRGMAGSVAEYVPEITLIKRMLSLLMKYGTPKVQLQACKGVINISRLDQYSLALIPCLDAALVVTHSAKSLSPELHADVGADDVVLDGKLLEYMRSAERQALKRSTQLTVSKALKSAMLVLIWILLDVSSQQDAVGSANGDIGLLAVITHHIDFLVDWLEVY